MSVWEELNIPVKEQGACGVNCKWALNASAGVLVISGTGAMHTPWEEVLFPDYHDDYHCYEASPWGSEHGSYMLHRLVIEEGVTAVDAKAFAHCSGLESVSLPSTLEAIEKRAFYGCDALQELILPDEVCALGKDWISGKTLQHVHLGAKSKLTADEDVFPFCSALSQVTVSAENPYYTVQDGMLLQRDAEGEYSRLLWCSVEAETVHVPETVRSIAKDAFFSCRKLRKLYIPASVEELGEGITVRNEKLRVYVVPNSAADRRREIFTACKNKVRYESGLFGFLHKKV